MNCSTDLWEKRVKEELLESVPYLLKMPSTRIWIDYDDEADVLYISFQKPQHADESELKENIIYHYRGAELVGITVIGAKQYQKRRPQES
jgi:uncharacterized protein YuzE